jgi:hypothetical protein
LPSGAGTPWCARARRLPPSDHSEALPADADPPERRREPAPLAQALTRIMRRYRLADTGVMDALQLAWPEVADPATRARARPGKFDGGILYLYAGSSAAIFELRRFKLRQLEESIRRHPALGRIRQVRLQLDPDQGSGNIV